MADAGTLAGMAYELNDESFQLACKGVELEAAAQALRRLAHLCPDKARVHAVDKALRMMALESLLLIVTEQAETTLPRPVAEKPATGKRPKAASAQQPQSP